MRQDWLPGGGDEVSEEAGDGLVGRPREIERERLEKEFHRPAAHDRIITQDDDGGKDRQQTQPFPAGAGREFLHRPEGPGPAAAADDGLRQEDGQGQDETRQDIDDDEGRAAMLSHHVGEAPDVAQAHGGPRHGHDYREAAAEMLALAHSRLDTNRTATPTGATNRMRK